MKILIVEDQKRLAESIKRGLEHEGYAADYVLDGEEAEKRLELYSDDYDLVLLDLMLPQMSGFELCRIARSRGIVTPILVLTARNTIEDKVAALDSGADDYLTKPFSFDELSARIRAILRRKTDAVLSVTLTAKNLELHPHNRTLVCGGKSIPLTLKEFSILEYLMRKPNAIVTREDLYSHLWDFSDNALSNVVDVHIKNVRKKLDANGSESRIETIRGIGYRLAA